MVKLNIDKIIAYRCGRCGYWHVFGITRARVYDLHEKFATLYRFEKIDKKTGKRSRYNQGVKEEIVIHNE